jgi:hypothetical protein
MYNRSLATDLIVSQIDTSNFMKFLEPFQLAEISFENLEVINSVASKVKLNPDFIQEYVSKCLAFCSSKLDKMKVIIIIIITIIMI